MLLKQQRRDGDRRHWRRLMVLHSRRRQQLRLYSDGLFWGDVSPAARGYGARARSACSRSSALDSRWHPSALFRSLVLQRGDRCTLRRVMELARTRHRKGG